MDTQRPSFWKTPAGFTALVLIVVVTYFLLMEHRQHVWQFLPYLILLACPFLHLFMHGSHGGHGGHQHGGGESEQDAYQRGLEDGRKEREHDH
ncbi:DUF2933 domain-containing protein [Methylophaga sp.]|uniref:DUF2933 domain-containing protein n=1 Tax=Methylophaga sp. TaxID=2024840 RepID=UPI001400D8D2|nr:DUF2933 domain-containing protein [Methylophaga sp.]MTI62510.1 DUF2933 domain-containing protein [Methylophaga sp.]